MAQGELAANPIGIGAERLTFDTAWTPDFDATDTPARASIAIFSTPRTGSQALSRLLYAVGLGVPAEYFLKEVVEFYSRRFLAAPPAINAAFMKDYVESIRTYRCRNGYVSYKIHADQHRQLTADLGSPWEDALPNPTIIRLRRRDIVSQIVSLGAALQTGIWDDISGVMLKRPGSLNERLAEKWTEYIFRSELYWDRYLAATQYPVIATFCEDLANAGRLQNILAQLGVDRTRDEIDTFLKLLPRSSRDRDLSQELASRFGDHISRHWQHLRSERHPERNSG